MECTAAEVTQTSQALERAVQCMRMGLASLRACYAAEASRDPRFTEIRGNVTKSGLLYHDLHLPLTIKLVEDLKTTFKDYEDLSADEFVTHVGVVVEIINELSENANLVIALNECLLTHLKCQKQDADELVAQFNLEEEVSQTKAALVTRWADSAKLRHDSKADAWNAGEIAAVVSSTATALIAGTATATTLTGGAGFLLAAAPLAIFSEGVRTAAGIQASRHRDAGKAAKEDGAKKALAYAEEAKNSLAAATVINAKLLVALGDFTEAIMEVAGFIRILKSDIDGYARSAEGAGNVAADNDRVRMYRNTMARFAMRITNACNQYIAFEPTAKAEMHVILPSRLGTTTASNSFVIGFVLRTSSTPMHTLEGSDCNY